MRGRGQDGRGIVREPGGEHGGMHEQAGEGDRAESADLCRSDPWNCRCAGARSALLTVLVLRRETHG